MYVAKIEFEDGSKVTFSGFDSAYEAEEAARAEMRSRYRESCIITVWREV